MTSIFIEMTPAGFGRWTWVSVLQDRTVVMLSTKPTFGFTRTREHAYEVTLTYLEAVGR